MVKSVLQVLRQQRPAVLVDRQSLGQSQRLVDVAARPKAKTTVVKEGVQVGLNRLHHRPLDDTVDNGRDAKRPVVLAG
jgi:hypothetical protein